MTPPTLQEVIEYAKEKQLAVDPEWFYNYFESADWHDSNDKPVRSWKQKMWTHHRFQLERGGMPKCCISGCREPGVHIIGKDRDGHPYRYCIGHKPQPKPLPPEHIVNTIKFKGLPKPESVSDLKNRALRKYYGVEE